MTGSIHTYLPHRGTQDNAFIDAINVTNPGADGLEGTLYIRDQGNDYRRRVDVAVLRKDSALHIEMPQEIDGRHQVKFTIKGKELEPAAALEFLRQSGLVASSSVEDWTQHVSSNIPPYISDRNGGHGHRPPDSLQVPPLDMKSANTFYSSSPKAYTSPAAPLPEARWDSYINMSMDNDSRVANVQFLQSPNSLSMPQGVLTFWKSDEQPGEMTMAREELNRLSRTNEGSWDFELGRSQQHIHKNEAGEIVKKPQYTIIFKARPIQTSLPTQADFLTFLTKSGVASSAEWRKINSLPDPQVPASAFDKSPQLML